MKAEPRIALVSLAVAVLAACSSSEPKGADQPSTTGEATSGATSAPASTSAATSAPTTAPVASSPATASPSSGPAAPPEVAKDPNPLILDVSVEATSGSLTPAEMDRIKLTTAGLIAISPVLAVPTSKGVTGTRKVITRLIVDPIKETKDKISVKVQINGITKDGRCPLFDLKQRAEMERTSEEAGDVDAVRNAAIQMVLKQLEQDAPKLKPNAQCAPDKPK